MSIYIQGSLLLLELPLEGPGIVPLHQLLNLRLEGGYAAADAAGPAVRQHEGPH